MVKVHSVLSDGTLWGGEERLGETQNQTMQAIGVRGKPFAWKCIEYTAFTEQEEVTLEFLFA